MTQTAMMAVLRTVVGTSLVRWTSWSLKDARKRGPDDDSTFVA